jgi:hypothetical protein
MDCTLIRRLEGSLEKYIPVHKQIPKAETGKIGKYKESMTERGTK